MYANTVRLSSWTSPRRECSEHLVHAYFQVTLVCFVMLHLVHAYFQVTLVCIVMLHLVHAYFQVTLVCIVMLHLVCAFFYVTFSYISFFVNKFYRTFDKVCNVRMSAFGCLRGLGSLLEWLSLAAFRNSGQVVDVVKSCRCGRDPGFSWPPTY